MTTEWPQKTGSGNGRPYHKYPFFSFFLGGGRGIFRSFRNIQKIKRYLENIGIFRNIYALLWLRSTFFSVSILWKPDLVLCQKQSSSATFHSKNHQFFQIFGNFLVIFERLLFPAIYYVLILVKNDKTKIEKQRLILIAFQTTAHQITV